MLKNSPSEGPSRLQRRRQKAKSKCLNALVVFASSALFYVLLITDQLRPTNGDTNPDSTLDKFVYSSYLNDKDAEQDALNAEPVYRLPYDDNTRYEEQNIDGSGESDYALSDEELELNLDPNSLNDSEGTTTITSTTEYNPSTPRMRPLTKSESNPIPKIYLFNNYR